MEINKINELSTGETKDVFTKCCGAKKWVDEMTNKKPFRTNKEMLESAENIWYSLEEKDWIEAFMHHPKIGDINSLKEKFSTLKDLAENEQSGVKSAPLNIITELAQFNNQYERKFGYIFIVCATGKSGEEMLSLIKERIKNDPETEILIAMKEQNKITKIRLGKLL